MYRSLTLTTVALTAVLLTGCTTAPEPNLVSEPTSHSDVGATSDINTIDNPGYQDFSGEEIATVGSIAKTARHSVVVIHTDQGSMGTGFLIAPDLVVTNEHVVESFIPDQTPLITATTTNGHSVDAEYIVGDMAVDVALLQLASPITGVQPLTFTTTAPAVGDTVMHIGHGENLGPWSVGIGSVSAHDFGIIETNLPITSGASGSPMLNMDGEVVAVISGIYGISGDTPVASENITVHEFVPATKITGAGGSATADVLPIIEGAW